MASTTARRHGEAGQRKSKTHVDQDKTSISSESNKDQEGGGLRRQRSHLRNSNKTDEQELQIPRKAQRPREGREGKANRRLNNEQDGTVPATVTAPRGNKTATKETELPSWKSQVPEEYWEFQALFQEELETGLPEHSEWDHEIPLQEGTIPRLHKIYNMNEKSSLRSESTWTRTCGRVILDLPVHQQDTQYYSCRKRTENSGYAWIIDS